MQSESVVDVRNDSTNKKTVTVLVPCFNEQESLPMLFDRMDALITQSKDLDYTLMFVDDGSRDNTKSLIKEYANQHDYVEYIFLSRNFGKEKAMYAGIENVHTDAMVIIDADLQTRLNSFLRWLSCGDKDMMMYMPVVVLVRGRAGLRKQPVVGIMTCFRRSLVLQFKGYG